MEWLAALVLLVQALTALLAAGGFFVSRSNRKEFRKELHPVMLRNGDSKHTLPLKDIARGLLDESANTARRLRNIERALGISDPDDNG